MFVFGIRSIFGLVRFRLLDCCRALSVSLWFPIGGPSSTKGSPRLKDQVLHPLKPRTSPIETSKKQLLSLKESAESPTMAFQCSSQGFAWLPMVFNCFQLYIYIYINGSLKNRIGTNGFQWFPFHALPSPLPKAI